MVLLVGGIGYEVLLPAVVKSGLKEPVVDKPVAFHIYHYQTERQPRPVLIGFNSLAEKAFFQQFISVADIGPLKAVKALGDAGGGGGCGHRGAGYPPFMSAQGDWEADSREDGGIVGREIG